LLVARDNIILLSLTSRWAMTAGKEAVKMTGEEEKQHLENVDPWF
jgi:hypothetical protein